MEFLLLLLGIVVLVVGYFCLGIFVKFLLAWWILTLGIPIFLAVGIAFGWLGAIAAVVGLVALLVANNDWQGSELYLALERKVDRAFYFSDT